MSGGLLADLFGGEVSKKIPSIQEEVESQATSEVAVEAALQALKEALVERVRVRVKDLDLCEEDRKKVMRELTRALRD